MKFTPLLFVLVAAWLVTLGIAFLSGRSTAPVETVDVPVEGARQTVFIPRNDSDDLPPAPDGVATIRPLDREPDDLPPRVEIRYVEKTAKPISFARVTRTLENNDPIARMAGMMEMLQQLTPEKAALMAESFDNMPEGYDRGWEKNLLLHAWAKMDGPGAIEYATRTARGGWGGHMAAYSVLSGWASTEPAAAEEWARSKTDSKDNGYLVGVIHGLARHDLQAATDLTYDLPYGRNRGRAVDALVNGHFQEGPRSAVIWAQNLSDEDEQLKAGITTRVVSKLAKTDPQGSVDLAMSLPEGEARQRAVGELADTWSEHTPERAADWVDQLEDPRLRSEAMAEVVSNWARKDPEETAAWLNTKEKGEAMDKPFERFARSISRENPESAMIWANQISDEKQRERALEGLANDWLKRDPEAARAFLGQ